MRLRLLCPTLLCFAQPACTSDETTGPSSVTIDAALAAEVDGALPLADAGVASDGETVSSRSDAGRVARDCVVTLCLTGAIKPDDSWNAAFEAFCDRPEIAETVIPYCRQDGCFSSWNNFNLRGPSLEDEIFPEVLAALDTTGDGKVDDSDESCALHLAGYSWGGVNAAKMAELIQESDAFAPSRKSVAKLVTFDPFQRGPFSVPSDYSVPSNVEKFWTFRHAVAKSGDCSSSSPGGPYYGLDAVCTAQTQCTDYNYTGDTNQYSWPAYGDSPAGSAIGDDLGHCTVLKAAVDAGFAVLTDAPLPTPLPEPSSI